MEPTHPEYQGSGPSEETSDPSAAGNQHYPPQERSRSWYENPAVQKVVAPGVVAAGLAAGAVEKAYAQETPEVRVRPQVKLEVKQPTVEAPLVDLETMNYLRDKGVEMVPMLDPNDDVEDHYIMQGVYDVISPEEISPTTIKITGMGTKIDRTPKGVIVTQTKQTGPVGGFNGFELEEQVIETDQGKTETVLVVTKSFQTRPLRMDLGASQEEAN